MAKTKHFTASIPQSKINRFLTAPFAQGSLLGAVQLTETYTFLLVPLQQGRPQVAPAVFPGEFLLFMHPVFVHARFFITPFLGNNHCNVQ